MLVVLRNMGSIWDWEDRTQNQLYKQIIYLSIKLLVTFPSFTTFYYNRIICLLTFPCSTKTLKLQAHKPLAQTYVHQYLIMFDYFSHPGMCSQLVLPIVWRTTCTFCTTHFTTLSNWWTYRNIYLLSVTFHSDRHWANRFLWEWRKLEIQKLAVWALAQALHCAGKRGVRKGDKAGNWDLLSVALFSSAESRFWLADSGKTCQDRSWLSGRVLRMGYRQLQGLARNSHHVVARGLCSNCPTFS